jgi:hypothetical protein
MMYLYKVLFLRLRLWRKLALFFTILSLIDIGEKSQHIRSSLLCIKLIACNSFEDKIRFIYDATFQHGRNLAFFVTIYKSLMLLQRTVKKEASSDAFIAGLIGGWIIFGKNNNINNQVSDSF